MPTNNITILYVEDEEVIRTNTQRPLKYLCEELIVAHDGEDGLNKYKQYNPDIIVSDIKMPKLNGIDMCKEIKAINPKQHIIFTTAHSENNYFMDAIEMQVDGYILKPIDYTLLKNKITEIIDTIDMKRKYQEQQEMLKQQELDMLEQAKNAQMGEMLANIAHQWRQPLSVISTIATGMLIEQEHNMLNEEKIIKHCNSINENAQFLSKTIDIFRDYIKEEKDLKTVVLQERINATINIIKSMLDMNNIQIINNIDTMEPINIKLVIGELSQVLINIINNAKDIMNEKNIEEKWIKIDLEKNNSSVNIIIEDNGGGIPQDILPKIFDPYFTTKHKSIGTGLGLHMSKNIIEKSLHGTISATNSPHGAKFTITLPLK